MISPAPAPYYYTPRCNVPQHVELHCDILQRTSTASLRFSCCIVPYASPLRVRVCLGVCVSECVCTSVRACLRACMRACVRVCVYVCVRESVLRDMANLYVT